ncbi:MAG: hypothetical protein ACI9N1_002628 [Flavobacteriales bacterium]|jgi:hypothetical protein
MFKEKKFLFRSLFWVTLGFFVVLIYTQLPDYKDKHLSYIPADADFVILVNSNQLSIDYFKLLDDNPIALDSLVHDPSWISYIISTGVDPNQKMGLFSIYDSITDLRFSGIAANAFDNKKFVVLTVSPTKPLAEVEYKTGFFAQDSASGKVLLRQENDIVVLSKIVAKAKDKDLLPEKYLTMLWDKFFSNSNTLIATNADFANMVISKEHFSVWVSGSLKVDGLPIIGDMFGEKIIESSIREEGMVFKGTVKMNDENGIIPRENEEIKCQGDECVRMAMNLRPQQFMSELEEFIPVDKSYILDNWNGAICMAVDEFKPVSIYKTVSHFDSVKNKRITKKSDLVSFRSLGGVFKMFGLNEFSYPFFRMGLEIDNVDELKSNLEKDSTITFENGHYSFVVPNVVVEHKDYITSKLVSNSQRLYFHIKDKNLIISPLEGEKNFTPSYATVGVDMNFQNFLKVYQIKDIMDVIALRMINGINIDEFILNVESIKSDEITLKGVFTLDTDQNHMAALPSLLNFLSEKFNVLF